MNYVCKDILRLIAQTIGGQFMRESSKYGIGMIWYEGLWKLSLPM